MIAGYDTPENISECVWIKESMMTDYIIDAATKEEWAARAFAAEAKLAKALDLLYRHADPFLMSAADEDAARQLLAEIGETYD